MTAQFDYNLQNWPLAVVMVLFASWLLYQFLAPSSWKDWSRAGLLQAFIIALYAEMYGFPLTIYLVTGILGVDIPLVHDSGHLWAALLGYGAIGPAIEMLLGSGFILAGLLMVMKGWVRIHFAHTGGRLITDGLYGVIRHPQYTGIFLIIFGQLVHWPTVITLALSPLIVLAYVRLARQEEDRLLDRFGDDYRMYQRSVPMFLPGSTGFPWQPRHL